MGPVPGNSDLGSADQAAYAATETGIGLGSAID